MNRRVLLGAALALVPEIAMGAKSRKQAASRRIVYDYSGGELADALDRAIRAWGLDWRRVDASPRDEPAEGDVQVYLQPDSTYDDVTQKLKTRGGVAYWRVKIAPWPDPDGQYSSVLHELGHVIGLTHSREPDSVMNPNQTALAPSEADLRRARRLLRG